MKRAWKVVEDTGNSLVINDDEGKRMVERVTEEGDNTDHDRAVMEWICEACNRFNKNPPAE